jgi:hypothetical protein
VLGIDGGGGEGGLARGSVKGLEVDAEMNEGAGRAHGD